MATGLISDYPVGSLVRARERDWVVLPSDDPEILCLRPLSGSESEICGIHRVIEGQHLRHGRVCTAETRASRRLHSWEAPAQRRPFRLAQRGRAVSQFGTALGPTPPVSIRPTHHGTKARHGVDAHS